MDWAWTLTWAWTWTARFHMNTRQGYGHRDVTFMDLNTRHGHGQGHFDHQRQMLTSIRKNVGCHRRSMSQYVKGQDTENITWRTGVTERNCYRTYYVTERTVTWLRHSRTDIAEHFQLMGWLDICQTWHNPGDGRSGTAELHQPMDCFGHWAQHNLTLDEVSRIQQN
jgi:hypothetical protein